MIEVFNFLLLFNKINIYFLLLKELDFYYDKLIFYRNFLKFIYSYCYLHHNKLKELFCERMDQVLKSVQQFSDSLTDFNTVTIFQQLNYQINYVEDMVYNLFEMTLDHLPSFIVHI
jgi:hypothetical protein